MELINNVSVSKINSTSDGFGCPRYFMFPVLLSDAFHDRETTSGKVRDSKGHSV